MNLVDASRVVKKYSVGADVTEVLRGIDLKVDKGQMVMIMGPSGCGKTTLLNILGGIDRPDEGVVRIGDKVLTSLPPRMLNRYRRTDVGFIFQFYNLIPTLTALENVVLGIEAVIDDKKEAWSRAERYLGLVGLKDKGRNLPQELSAGQQQRVAIARALAKEPKLILADEPTGNLDEERGQSIMELMNTLQGDLGMTFVIVSHNTALRSFVDRTLHLHMGVLEETSPADEQVAVGPGSKVGANAG